jgi:hypothetical protein
MYQMCPLHPEEPASLFSEREERVCCAHCIIESLVIVKDCRKISEYCTKSLEDWGDLITKFETLLNNLLDGKNVENLNFKKDLLRLFNK